MTPELVTWLLQRHGQTLSLIRRDATPSIDPETGSLADSVSETIAWSGVGSLQANTRETRNALPNTTGGVEETLVPYKAYLPWDAHPRHGWVLRDSVGREYEMLTSPQNPGGINSYWLLHLGNPSNAPQWAYISTGLWVSV